MEKYDAVVNDIEDWSNEELVEVWNQFCDDCNYFDDRAESMDSFDDLFCGTKPSEIAEMVSHGDFNYSDDYYSFDGYGDIYTYSDIDDNRSYDAGTLADWIIENGDSNLPKHIDTDYLIEEFINEYYSDADDDKINAVKDKIEEDGSLDFLMDDWDYIYDSIETEEAEA